MFKYGQVIIYPDNKQPNHDIFIRELKYGEGHIKYFQEYSDKMNLGFKFAIEDSNDAPCRIALLGNVVIKTVDDVKVVMFYLPQKITDEQYNWIYKNQQYFNDQRIVSAISFSDGDNVEYQRINGFDNILKVINKKNLIKNDEFISRWKNVR